MQMQSIIKVSFSSANGISKAYAFGELKFKQKNTLESSYNIYFKLLRLNGLGFILKTNTIIAKLMK